MSNETPPPKKRYKTTIEISHHGGADLVDELRSVALDTEIAWTASNGIPFGESFGSHCTISHTEQEGYTPEDEYRAALEAWWRDRGRARYRDRKGSEVLPR